MDLLDIGGEKDGDLLNMNKQNEIDLNKMYEKAKQEEKPFGLENLGFANNEDEFTDFQSEEPQQQETKNDEIIW